MTRRLRHGEPWGHAATGPPDVELAGDDADLAVCGASHPGELVRFRPSPQSDLARAPGLRPGGTHATEVAIDALDVRGDRVCFGSTTGNVYISEDRGESWRCVGNNFPPVHSVRFA